MESLELDSPPAYPGSESSPILRFQDGSGLVAYDFLPQIIDEGSAFGRPSHELFNVLVDRANEFLRANLQFTANTCESIEFTTTDGGRCVENIGSVYVFSGDQSNVFMRGLRLWLRTRSTPGGSCDRIGYYNFLPKINQTSDAEEGVERLDSLFCGINAYFRANPVPGRIITVETQPIKWKSGGVGPQPDTTIWTERGTASATFVNLLRVFYVYGEAKREQIMLCDFVPEVKNDEGALFGGRIVDTFPVVLARAQAYLLSVPPNYRIINVQSVVFRWSFNKGIDTQRMVYREHKLHLNYLRYLRVACVIENIDEGPLMRPTIQLSSKLFIPSVVVQGECCGPSNQYENQEAVRRRIDQWVRATGASVVSVETVPMRIEGGGESAAGFDAMYTHNETHTHRASSYRNNESFAYLYRVYLDGIYRDPPGMEQDMSLEEYVRSTNQADCCIIL